MVTIAAVKSPRDKAALVSADVRRAGRRMESDAVGALVDALGSDLRELLSAVDQLVADTRGTITVQDVNTYYAGRFEATGFTVADAAAAGDVARAITALRHALATGTEPVPIVAALAMKIRQLARVAAMAGRGGVTAGDLGMAPWQVDRARRELSGWSDDALAAAIGSIQYPPQTSQSASPKARATNKDSVTYQFLSIGRLSSEFHESPEKLSLRYNSSYRSNNPLPNW